MSGPATTEADRLRATAMPTRCPVCGGCASALLRTKDRNRAITDATFAYDRCGRCETVFIREIPADLARYYEASYYQFDAGGEPSWRGEAHRQAAASYRVELIRRHVAGGHLIELGAGTGAFAVSARDGGFRVSAVEMSETCCSYLDRQRDITAICSDDPKAALGELGEADVIAMWHVLEHLDDPVGIIRSAAARLKVGGVLALAVPNPTSFQFQVLKARWMHLDAPRHLRLLPPRAIVRIGQEHGLALVEMTTSDPDGRECDLYGWINALPPPPALSSGNWLTGQLGGVAWRLASPIETRAMRGSAVTLLLRK